MEEKQPYHSEEIDLFYLFRPFARLLRRIGAWLSHYLAVLQANLVLFAAIILVLTGLGFSLRFFVPTSYVTKGTFASRILPIAYCDIITKNLNEQIGEAQLPEELHLSEGLARNIRSISLTPVDVPLDSKDTTLRSFTFRLRLRKMEGLDSIQQALIGYFENNEYALKQKGLRRSMLLAVRSEITAKIASLDSLSPIVNNSIIPRSTGQGIILGQPIDPVNVYKAQVTYYEQRVEIDRDLANLSTLETVQSFYKLSRPNYPDFDQLFLYSFLISLVVALWMTPVYGKKV